MFKPLEGVKVIDLTYFVAGPGTSRILADWGADVIKVEPTFGDPGRKVGNNLGCPITKECNPFYSAYNSNKRGLALNLKSEEGQAIMDKLLENADVFLSSYRTGALKRLGLDYATLSKKYPHLIWAQVNGFGDFGPAKDNAGFDLVAYWARSGAMMDQSEKDTSPLNPLLAFGDASTSCTLAGGISAALYQKARTGKGCKVMVSLFTQALWSNSACIISAQYGDEYPKTRKNPANPGTNSFRSSDGRWFFMSIIETYRYNPILFKELGREDLIGDTRFSTADCVNHSAELTAILDEEFAKYTLEEICAMLNRADIAYDVVQHLTEVLDDPQALENQYILPIENYDGTVTKQAMTPIRFALEDPTCIEDIAPTTDRQAPLIGEHSVEILREYGYSDAEIEKFLADEVIVVTTL